MKPLGLTVVNCSGLREKACVCNALVRKLRAAEDLMFLQLFESLSLYLFSLALNLRLSVKPKKYIKSTYTTVPWQIKDQISKARVFLSLLSGQITTQFANLSVQAS